MKQEERLLSGLDKLMTCYRQSMAIVPDFMSDVQNWESQMQDRNRWMEQAEEIDKDLRPLMAEWRQNMDRQSPDVNRRIRQSADDLVSLLRQVMQANDRMHDSMGQQKRLIGDKLLNLKGKRNAITCYSRNQN